MNKHILIFGAGRSATSLIEYLKKFLEPNSWTLTVADNNAELAASKTGKAPGTTACAINVHNEKARMTLISKADIVISLLPPALHFPVAVDCCRCKKHLLTASYISPEIESLEADIRNQNVLFLCEMGLDPGIDHMSAMQIINRLKASGAIIHSFKSHCGGLVSPESDDNPWHYKISWNAGNVVSAGTAGAIFRKDGKEVNIGYTRLFDTCSEVNIPGLGNYAYYPNRDSLSYIPVYGLDNTKDFLRTTLRHPDYCTAWQALVSSGLINKDPVSYPEELTFSKWSLPLLPYLTDKNKLQFKYLGFFDESLIPAGFHSSAAIVQYLLEKHLLLGDGDRDMVIMLHEFVYSIHNRKSELKSLLVVKGQDKIHTAMAKTVGLPLGIAARLILEGTIQITGLHIPVLKEIYEPVMKELEKEGIVFTEENYSL